MLVKPRITQSLKVAALATALVGCRAAQKEVKDPTFFLQAPRIVPSLEYAHISQIPDNIRQVHAYKRPQETFTLPKQTSGLFYSLDLGLGLNYRGTAELGLDFVVRDSFSSAITGPWDIKKTSGNDYVGYHLHGWELRPSLLVNLLTPNKGHSLYLKGSYIVEWGTLDSGTDAWADFQAQHSVPLQDKLYIGLNYRPFIANRFGFVPEFDFGLTAPLRTHPLEIGGRIISLGILVLRSASF